MNANPISEPLVSIIMPCYNAEKFLAETIKTVLAQTYQKWELIIVDDMSTDNSSDIIMRYAEQDKRIRAFRLSQKGFTHGARNYAMDKAAGQYAAFLDSDDLWMRDKLEKQIRYMQEEDCPFTLTDNYMMNIDGQIFTRPYRNPKITTYRSLLLKYSAIHFSSVVYSLKDLGKLYFQEKEPEDYMFCLELLKLTHEAMNLGEVLTVYRIANPLSNSGRKSSYAMKTWKLYRSMGMNFFQTCYCFAHYAVKGVLRYLPYKKCPYMKDISFLNLPKD